jgi:two-component system NtrC family sensor kinase
VSGSRVGRLSLRTRLLWMAALMTGLVVGATTYLKNRIIEATVEREALDAARLAALGVAADLTDRETLPTAADLEELLAEFTRAVPAIRSLTITRVQGDGSAIEASTESNPPAAALELARQVTVSREPAVSEESAGPVRFVAVPLERERKPYGAVVVTMSMDALARVRRQTRITALIVTAVTILALTAFFDIIAGRLVHRRLHAVRETMTRASEGDLSVRAPVDRADEIGALAAGLNAMLDRMSDFNEALRQEVQRATGELQQRNEQLVESAQRLFSTRRELARFEQLAVTGQMAASVAHQIGTPLNLISGYVQMILEELPPASSAAARLETVQEQIAKVTAIVQSLLDQARRPVLHRRAIDPAELVSNACELARPTLDASGIALRAETDGSLPPISVDVGQIEQAFLNLITNSIDAMPEGGILTVSVRAAMPYVEFEVADSGCGIPREYLGRIFDPLFTTKRPGKGTGLGLTITREVVAAHGGSLSVTSETGRGTAVIVRLPGLEAAQREARA